MATAAQARQHQRDLATLTGVAAADLAVLWRKFKTPDQARDRLLEVLPRLVQVYGTAAATLAADWYDDVRAEDRIPGRFRAAPIALPDDLGTDQLARWGVGPLFASEPDWDAARSLVTGGVQRRIADADRETVTTSSYADPAADGWQRVSSGGCAFCQMVASNGTVFTQASDADFASHDNCSCVAVAAFSGLERPVKQWSGPAVGTAADRARVREYLRTH